MNFTNTKTNQQERGFTIVELLIVVVVIAILAAITIVSYNGITNRANASAAATSAATVQKKSELYAADGPTGKYPLATADLTGAAGTATYALSGINFTTGPTVAPTAANGKDTVRFLKCAAAGTTTQASITSANITGLQIDYFDFEAGTGVKSVKLGTTAACPAAV